jgi:hypothetical protein
MYQTQERHLQALRRMVGWFPDHPSVIAGTGASAVALTGQVTALQGVIVRVTDYAAAQVTQYGQSTLAAKDELTLRKELRSLHLKAIVSMAKGLKGKVPGMGVFKLPSGRTKPETLLQQAQSVRVTASPYRAVFVEHGLPGDFLEQLDASIAALKQSVDARGAARSGVSEATTGLKAEFALAAQIAKTMDASLTHVLKSDASLMQSWRQAKRITASAKRSVAAVGGSGPLVGAVATPAGVVSAPAGAASAPSIVDSRPV